MYVYRTLYRKVFILSNGLGGGGSIIGLVQRLILTRGCGPCGQQTSTLHVIKPNQVSGWANHFFSYRRSQSNSISQLRNDRLTAEG